jgi:hypothetical protein
MATETDDYGFNTPVPGTEEDNWGVLLNENFQAIENCFNGFTEVAPNLAVGFWKIDDFAVTATAEELNQLASITATPTEINYSSGVTSNIQTQLDTLSTDKAPLESPALTGTPTAPTAAVDTDTTQVATTAFVQDQVDADVADHAALRSSSTVYGHAKMYVSGGNLYIVTT